MIRFIAIALLMSCTDADRTRSILESQGYTDIKVGGYRAWACGRDDSTCTGFSATTPSGRPVRGVVGCGFGCTKNCTVRFNP